MDCEWKFQTVVGAGSKERGNIWLWLELVVGAQSTKERGNIWLWLELVAAKEMKEKIFGCGWSSINEGKARENTWVELHRQAKYLASENGIVFGFNETLCLNFGV